MRFLYHHQCDNDTTARRREQAVEIQSRGMCRADGKAYEKLVVSGLGATSKLRALVDEADGRATLPCEVVLGAAEGTGQVVYLVCDLVPLRQCCVRLAEVDERGQVISCVDHQIDLERAKWSSRANRLLNGSLVEELTRHEGAVSRDERNSVAVTTAIPTPTHLILRGTYRFAPADGARPHVFCANDRLEVVAERHTPMGSRSVSVAGGLGALTEESFSLRIPWNQGNVFVCARDDARPGVCAYERLSSERLDALVQRATGDLYNNAWGDPYYPEWFSRQRPTSYELDLQRQATFDHMPTFSLVVPLFRTPAELFAPMLDSVLSQTYGNWELVLVNASPESAELRALVEEACARDQRVRCVTLDGNHGISENTNAGIAVATGEFVGFFDHDDVIEPNLLFEYTRAINDRPDTDVLYCDEDKIDETGTLTCPLFKGQLGIDDLRGFNIVCHLLCIRRILLDRLEPNTAAFDGAQDHNLALKAVEQARYVNRVPKVLYHWRVSSTSAAGNSDSKPYAIEAGLRAVRAHLERMGLRAEVYPSRRPFTYVVNYLPPEDKPLVSIVIPTSDHAELLERCVGSILEKSTYANYEVLLVDNNSHEERTEACYERLVERGAGRVRVERYAGDFNFSAIVNHGVRAARGDYLLLLNNDTELITPDWIERLLGNCAREEVGAVGVRLFYPDDTVQHAGVCVSGMGAGHLFHNYPRETRGYFYFDDCQRDLSAVTAACMMFRRDAFEAVGGFDEELAVAYNDVDFCLKLRARDLLVVYTPEVELYHYESISRGSENSAEKARRYHRELTLLLHRWSDFYADGDPYYTPELQPTMPNCCYYRF